jgi:uncharacterized protein YkwD
MYNKFFLALSIFAILAINSSAQKNSSPSGPNETSNRLGGLEAELTRFLESDEDTPDPISRPRIVNVKMSGVGSSVIVNTGSLERNAFELLNEQRAANGQLALQWSESLASVARLHSQNMAEFSFFSHRGLDGKMVSDRADDNSVGKWRSIGENIAFNKGYKDPVAKAVELWLDSPSHRQNLMDSNWKETAVGIAVAPDGSFYFTQVFLRK